MRKHKTNPSANQNWIKTETLTEYKKQAAKTLESEQQKEAEGNYVYVVVCEHPFTRKRGQA